MKTRVGALLALFAIGHGSAEAQRFWSGAGDTYWTNAGNWVGATVPLAGEDVVFDANAAANLGTRLGADFTLNSLTVSNPAGAVSLSSNTLSLGAGGLQLAGATVNLTIASTLIPIAAQDWNVAAGRVLTVSGPLQGAGAVTKKGQGALVLSGANTNFTGGLWVENGDLTVSAAGALGATDVVFNSAATLAPGIRINTANGINIPNVLVLQGLGAGSNVVGSTGGGGNDNSGNLRLRFDLRGRDLVIDGGTDRYSPYGGFIRGTGDVWIVDGRVDIGTATNTWLGALRVPAGGIFQNNSDEMVPNTADLYIDGTFQMNTALETVDALNGTGLVHNITAGTRTLVVGADGGSGEFSGRVRPNVGTLIFVKSGAGTQVLSGLGDNDSQRVVVNGGVLALAKTNSASAHAAAIDVTVNGGTLQLAGTGDDQIWDGSVLNVNGGTFDMNGLSEKINPLQSVSTNGTILNSAAGTLSVLYVGTNNGSGAYYGSIAQGAGTVRVVKVGTGTQTFGGRLAMDYLVVSNGTVRIGGGPGSWSCAGTIVNEARLEFASQGLILPPAITGTGAVSVAGPFGGLLFTNSTSFSGPLTVAGGFVQFGDCTSTGDLATTLNMASGTLVFARSDDLIWGTAITGSVNVLKLCDNLLTLGAANTYTGGTRVKAGRMLVTGALAPQRWVSVYTNADFDPGLAGVTLLPTGRWAVAGNRIDTWESGRMQVSRPAGGSLTNTDVQLVMLGGTFDFRGARPVASAFPANDLTNQLAFWLRADAGVQTDGSGNVTNWLDSSKYIRDMRVTGTRPLYLPAIAELNDQPVVRCTGLNRLKTQDIVGPWPTRNCSIFIVARATNNFNVQSTFLTMVTTTNEAEPALRWMIHFPWNDGNVYMGVPYGNWLNYQPGAAAMAQFSLWHMRNSYGGLGRPRGRMIIRNGVQEAFNGTAPAYDTPIGRHLALAGFAANAGWQGDLAEVMIFTNALSRTDEEQVGGYLARKYGFLGVYDDQPATEAAVDLAAATIIVSNSSVFYGGNATTVRVGSVQLAAGATSVFQQTIANVTWPDNGLLPGATDDQTAIYPSFASYDMPISGPGAVMVSNGIVRFVGDALHTYSGGLYLGNYGRLVLAKTNGVNNTIPTNVFLNAAVWNTGAGSFHGGIELEADEQIPDGTVLTLGGGQWNALRTYGHTETIAGMTGNNLIVEDTRFGDTNGHAMGHFIVSNDVPRTFHGLLRDNDGGTNRMAFTKRGSGTLTFATGGDWLNWSGPTKVYDGELVLNNSGSAISGSGAEWNYEVFTNATLTYGNHNHHGTWNAGQSANHTIYEGGVLRNNGAWVNVLSNITLAGGKWQYMEGYDRNQKAWSVRGNIVVRGTNTTSEISDKRTGNGNWGIGLGSNNSTTNILDVADGAVDVDLKVDAQFYDTFINASPTFNPGTLRKIGAGKVVFGRGQGFTGPFSVEGGTVIFTNSPLSGELDLSNGVQVVMTGGRGLVGEYKLGFSALTNFNDQTAWDRYWAGTNSTHLYSSRDGGYYGPRDTFDFDGGGNNFQPPFNANNGNPVFEARWRGKFIAPAAGVYTFFTASDDGSMLWIDGTNIVFNNFAQGVTERSNAVPVTLTAGEHDIAYHYHNSGGGMGFYSYFIPPGGVKQVMSNHFLRSGSGCGGLSGDAGTRLSISNYLFTVAQRYDRTFGGNIDGDAGLVKTCLGQLTLAGTNTYLGGTEVRGGTLQLASAGAWAGAALLVEDGTFDLNGYSITCTNFDGARGTLTNSAATPVTLTLNPTDANREVFLGNLGGEIGLAKSGTNLLWLGGANAHNGPFAINGGVLRYDGVNAGTSAVAMAAGTTLCGTGTLGGAVSVPNGSFIGGQPNFAPTGTLSMAALNLAAGATVSVFLNGTNPTLRVTGLNGFSTGGTTNRVELKVAGTLQVGTYRLIDYEGVIGGGGFGALVLAGLPPGVTGSLFNNTVDGYVELNVTAVDQLRWTGAVNNLWDTNTLNWVTAGGLVTNYYEGVGVLFNDLGNNVAITVQTNGVAPGSIAVSNLTKVYSWGGGGIGGLGGIQKLGAGMLIISNANAFLDDVVISNGTIKAAAATALGSLNGGTFVRSGGALDINGQSLGKERVHLAGTGVTNEGCYYNTAAYISGRGTNTPGWIKLLADATISGGPSGFEFGRDAGKAVFDWNGFRLTKIGAGNIWFCQCVFNNAADTVFTGNGNNLGLDDISNPAFVTNTWGVGEGAILYFYSDDGVRDDYPIETHLTNASLWANGGNSQVHLMRTINLYGATNWLRGGGAGFITGSIVGTSRVARAETGWWAISSTNTYTGGTLLNAGEFILGYGINNAPTNSGSLVGDIIINGGTFNYAHAIAQTVTNNILGLGNAVNGYVNSRVASGVTFDASATVNMTSQVLRAGTYNYGQMFFRTGCVVNAYGMYIADLNNTAGDVTMNGGSVNLSGSAANFALRVGAQANTGSLRMQGGLLTVSNSQMSVGWDGTGILYLQGGEIVARGMQLNANGTNGNGRLIVEGGRITIGGGGIPAPGLPSTNYLGGGVLGALENWDWSAAQPGYLSGTNGNLTFDTATNVVTVYGWLSGTGGVNKVGAGRLLLNGTNTYSGWTVVSNGSLFGLASLASPVAVRSNAVLGAASGTPAGTLAISNNVVLDAGAILGTLLNGTNPTLRITGALSNGAVTLVRVYAAQPAALGAYPLVDYTGTLAGVFDSAFQLQALPAGVSGYLSNNTANTTIDLVVTNVAGGLRWYGDVDNVWDTGLTANWRNADDAPALFNVSDAVRFDDTATNFTVTPATPVEPVSVLFSNTQPYLLSGGVGLVGAASVTKLGTGTVVVVNTNAYTGVTSIRDGVLQVGAGGTAGDLLASPVVVTNTGTLLFYRTDGANTYRVPTTVSGNGAWVFQGSGANQVSDYLLTNANPGFAGTMMATNARVQVTNTAYVGTASLVAQGGGQFLLANITQTRPMTIAGQGWLEGGATRGGAVRFINATNAGPITLAGDARLTAWGGQGWMSGNIGGGNTLESWQNGGNVLYLSGTNTFNHLNLSGGWLEVNNPQAVGTGTVIMAGGGLSAFQNDLTLGNPLLANNTIYLGQSLVAADKRALTWTGNWNLGGAGRQCHVHGTNTVLGSVTNGGLEVMYNGLMVFNGDVRLSHLHVNYNGINGFVRQDGGAVHIANAGGTDFRIGHWSTFGSYTLNGGVLSNAAGRISVGWDGTGYLTINGGTVYSPWIRMDDAGADNPARLNLNGGQLILGASGIDRDGTGYLVNLGGGTLGAYANWSSTIDWAVGGTNGNVQVNGMGYVITLGGALTGTGRLDKVGTGTLVLNGPYNAGAITVNGGALGGTGTLNAAVTAAAGLQPGYATVAGPLTATAVTFQAGAVFNPLANGTASVLRVTGTNGLAVPAGTNVVTVNVSNLLLAVGTYTVIDYAGAVQGGDATNLVLGVTPPRSVMYLTNNLANTSIDLVVVQAGEAIKWYGSVDGNWNINAPTNWITATGGVQTAYLQPSSMGDAVVFDDTAVGNFAITLLTNVAPAALVASNSANDYAIGGGFGIGGPVTLQKYGGGTFSLSMSNGFTGGANLQGGALRLVTGGTLGDGAVANAGSLVFGNDDTSTFANAVSGTGRVVMDGTGRKTLTGALTYNGSTIVSNGLLAFDQTIGHRYSSFVVEDSGTLLINAIAGVDSWVYNLNSAAYALSGTGTIIKTGAGWFQFDNAGPGTFAGRVIVSNGVFGSAMDRGNWVNFRGDVTVVSNALGMGVLDLRSDPVTIDELWGGGEVWNSWNSQAQTLTVGAGGGSSVFSGRIRGAGGGGQNNPDGNLITLSKVGTGTLVLAGQNTYGGGTIVFGGGVLEVDAIADGVSNASRIGTAGGSANYLALQDGTLRWTGTGTNRTTRYLWIDQVQAGSAIEVSQTNGLLELAPAGGNSVYPLTKLGPGVLALAGTATFNAPLAVSNGTLLVNRSIGTGTVTVAAGGTLGGTGSIGGTVNQEGVLSPGTSIGTLAIAGQHNCGVAAVTRFELGGTNAPTDYDRLVVGDLQILGGELAIELVNSFVPTSGDQFVIMENTAGLLLNEFTSTNAPALSGGLGWRVDYASDRVTLVVTGTVYTPTPYEAWAASIPNPADRGDQADPDGDGYANLWEYSQGSDPTNSGSVVKLQWFRTNGAAYLRFNRVTGAVDVVYEVEASYGFTNPAPWEVIASNVFGTGWNGDASVTETNSGAVRQVLTEDNDPASTRRGMRLRVTRP